MSVRCFKMVVWSVAFLMGAAWGDPAPALWSASSPHRFICEAGPLRFGEAHPESLAYLGEGWRTADGAYLRIDKESIWAPSLKTSLHLPILRKRALALQLTLGPMFVEPLGGQYVEVAWNGHRIGSCTFSLQDGWKAVDFRLDVPAYAQEVGDNEITFHSRYAVSPLQAKTAKDGRIHAFCLYGLSLLEGGQPLAPKSLVFSEKAIEQPGGTLLRFPVRIPDTNPGALQISRPAAEGNWRITLEADGLDGKEVRVLAQGGEAASEGRVDWAPYAGKRVVVSYDTSACGAVSWPFPKVPSPTPSAAPSGTGAFKAKNVVFVICDAMRRDGLGVYGYARNTSPVMDQLAREGLFFRRGYCAAPYTYSSTWSLVTGLYPFQHQASEHPLKAAYAAPRLAQPLKAAGIYTGCISAQHWISPRYGTTEFFDAYEDAIEPLKDLRQAARPELLTDKALAFIEAHQEKRFFLYLHYRPPHEPYYPPKNFQGSMAIDPAQNLNPDEAYMLGVRGEGIGFPREQQLYMRARYDENLRGVDNEISRLVSTIKQLKLAEETLVVVTADHGEAFMEHDFLGHGQTLYEEVAGIPLILWGGGVQEAAPERIEAAFSNVDYYPTICDVLGVTPPAGLPGRSLFAPKAAAPYGVEAFCQGGFQRPTHTWDPREAYWFKEYKLILDRVGHRVEVYDLKRDPREASNLAPLRPVLTEYLRAHADAWRAHQAPLVNEAPIMQEVNTSDEAQESLQALGYL